MAENIFKGKKCNPNELLKFGFKKEHDTYVYSEDIAMGQFTITVSADACGKVVSRVIDKADGEEYVLHKTPGATGAFIGIIREECNRVLGEICEKCFLPDVFKSDQTGSVISYAGEKYACKPEFLWDNTPDCAVLRRGDSDKWFAVIMTVSKRKLGLDSDDMAEIIDLRAKPEVVKSIVDGRRYFPGWHMNKKSWFTVILDGRVSLDELLERVDDSYRLAAKHPL